MNEHQGPLCPVCAVGFSQMENPLWRCLVGSEHRHFPDLWPITDEVRAHIFGQSDENP